MISIAKVKTDARRALSGNWGKIIGAFFISLGLFVIDLLLYWSLAPNYQIITFPNGDVTIYPTMNAMIINLVVLWLTVLFITFPIYVGFAWFFVDLYDGKQVSASSVLQSWRRYGKIVATILLVYLFTMLWSLLFVVPGIVKGYSYSMAFILIKDNPEMSPFAAITESRRLMNGNKGKMFVLQLSFLGWMLLPFVNFLYGVPYLLMSYVAFMRELTGKKELAEEETSLSFATE